MDLTDDACLGGARLILPPKRSDRAGLDAVLLAAACPARGGENVVDAGAGVGTVGLCVARRVEDVRVTLVEMEPELADLARQNVERNGLAVRVAVVDADVRDGGRPFHAEAGGLTAGAFAHAVANPPYLSAGDGTEPTNRLKAAAHSMPGDDLDQWVRFLATALTGDGTATMIHRADALRPLLGAFDSRFGAIKVFPIFPREGMAANRIIVHGVKGSRAPLQILPGLVLHGDAHEFRPQAEAILRDGAALMLE
ncbi:MAG: tRNA1(Val) (adenine(37)-N6)-methyltransferase [Hyphomicrobiaceae bacterium]